MAGFSNQKQTSVSVRKPRKGQVSMALPRSDSGKVVKSPGGMSNASAAHFADAMGKIVGGPAMPAHPQSQGD